MQFAWGGSYPLPWEVQLITGDFTWTYQSLAGCDSVVTIHISVNDTFYLTSESHAICQGGSYPLPWGGTADHAGDFTWTYQSVAGCDSVVTIHISVNDTYSTSESHAICQGGSYPLPWEVQLITQEISHGPISLWQVVTVWLLFYIFCKWYLFYFWIPLQFVRVVLIHFPWGGSADHAGDFTWTYQSLAGCDSVVTIHITVNPVIHTDKTNLFARVQVSISHGRQCFNREEIIRIHIKQLQVDSSVISTCLWIPLTMHQPTLLSAMEHLIHFHGGSCYFNGFIFFHLYNSTTLQTV